MQQVECYLNGTYDYSLINGSTGPIVLVFLFSYFMLLKKLIYGIFIDIID